jgi:hypothetical protein
VFDLGVRPARLLQHAYHVVVRHWPAEAAVDRFAALDLGDTLLGLCGFASSVVSSRLRPGDGSLGRSHHPLVVLDGAGVHVRTHQTAGHSVLTILEDRGQPIADRQRRKLFRAPAEISTGTNQDRTHVLLRKSCERLFEIAIGPGISNNELEAKGACRRL